jgi:aromatic-amino-acid transaminase
MFEKMEMAPPDPILGLTAAFRDDPNPLKINLGVGVYKDENGATPIMASVKTAERKLLESEGTKSYLPIDGEQTFGSAVRTLLFGKDAELAANGRAVTLHTPGGTGGLRLAGEFLRRSAPTATLWMSDPTWANHHQIFSTLNFPVKTYPYYDAAGKQLDFEAMIAWLETASEGDIVLLHGCCHNPTGLDPSDTQWQQIGAVLAARKTLPLVDFAYQGLAEGIEEDAAGLRILAKRCDELIVISSFSKNFGLYRERTGAMTLVAKQAEDAAKALSHAKQLARTNYSNPPAHGGAIVTTILNDPDLSTQWFGEVAAIRNRIRAMRHLFVEKLNAKGVEQDFSFITKQNGMFSFSGLSREQVETLRQEHSIYIVGSGRINVAGMTEENMDRLVAAIAEVLA